MSLSFIGAGAAQANTVSIPTHQAGDLIVIFAFRDDSTTAPSVPAGFTSAGSNTGTVNSSIIGYKRATSSGETSGTWTNALGLVVHVYRGAFTSGPPIIRWAAQTGTANTINYSGITTMYESGGSSWVARFAGTSVTDNSIETAPTGHTNRASAGGSGAVLEVVGHDTNGGVSSSSFGSVSAGGSAGNYISITVEIVADNAGSGVEAKTAQLAGATVTGQQKVTSPAMQPKALIITHGLQTAAGAAADAQFTLGFGDTAGNERAAGYNSDDNVATSDASRHFRTGDIIRSYVAGATTSNLAASLDQLDRTGFSPNWGDVTLASALYNYLAIGGQDITQVKAGSFALDTVNATQDVTDPGFQPDIVLFAVTLNTTNTVANNINQMAIGVMDAAGNQWTIGQRQQNGQATMNASRVMQTNRVMSLLASAGNTEFDGSSYNTMLSNGFRLNRDTNGATACLVEYLAIKGGSWKVGTETQKTSTGVKQTTGLGSFTPKGIIFGGVCDTATGINDHARLFFGMATSPTQNTAIWTGDRDNVPDAIANTIMKSDKCIVMATEATSASPTTDSQANLDAVGNGTFDLNWTTADATARLFGFIAFGNNAGGTSTAAVVPVLAGFSVQTVTATYAAVKNASTASVNAGFSVQAVTAHYNAVKTATTAPVLASLSVQAVVASSSSVRTATTAPVLAGLSIQATTAAYNAVKSAVTAPVLAGLSIQTVLAHYNQVNSAAVVPILASYNIQVVAASYNSVRTASVGPVLAAFIPQTVLATYQAHLVAALAPVLAQFILQDVTANHGAVKNAGVVPVLAGYSVQAVTPHYAGVYSAATAPVLAQFILQAVSAGGGTTAAMAPVLAAFILQALTATHRSEAAMLPVLAHLSIQPTTANYDQVNAAAVVPVIAGVSVQSVHATHHAAAVVGPLAALFSLLATQASYDENRAAQLVPVGAGIDVPEVEATYLEEPVGSSNFWLLLLR